MNMKILNLIIKQKYFDAIMQGRKVQEFREVRPTNGKRLVKFLCNGNEYAYDEELPEDGEIDIEPIKYDAIRFYVGYNKDRDSALVEITDAYFQFIVNEFDEQIFYEYKGAEYFAGQVVYDLGKIIEKDIKVKTKI